MGDCNSFIDRYVAVCYNRQAIGGSFRKKSAFMVQDLVKVDSQPPYSTWKCVDNAQSATDQQKSVTLSDEQTGKKKRPTGDQKKAREVAQGESIGESLTLL